MSDTTLPPTKSSSRKKVALRKGFGLTDWNRLLRSSSDLAQRKGQPLRRIQWKEIRQHNSVYDGWIVLKGKVYFISPYLAYHPGGEAILKQVLGKDATALYEKYHRWVNEDHLIGKLLIGYLDTTPSRDDDTTPSHAYVSSNIPTITKDGFAVPIPRPPRKIEPLLSDDHDVENSSNDATNLWET